jgi:hypothetical protein
MEQAKRLIEVQEQNRVLVEALKNIGKFCEQTAAFDRYDAEQMLRIAQSALNSLTK